MAARAAHAAIGLRRGLGRADLDTITRLHQALRPTRGAAASILHPQDSNEVSFIGVGNVLGVVASDLETRRMVNFNGTLGHALKAVRPFGYPTRGETLAVLASDGLGTHWSLDLSRLESTPPDPHRRRSLRDFDRGRDDVTVVVAKRQAVL